jgi:hypothetical protein
MEINRNNYEEYFLLYADNELSKTEKKVVEIFVQENIDLKEEFLMIQLTVNSPEEEVKLADKAFLIKQELFFINENNFEEIFVLYFDDELSESEKKEVENFVTENLQYKTDFDLIGKAKLISDNSIVYPGKKHLYKKGKPGKIIPLILWRSMAAAVFIGLGLWFSVFYFTKTDKNIPVASHLTNAKKSATTEKNIVRKESMKENNEIAASTNKTKSAEIKKEEREIKKPILKEIDAHNVTIVKPAKKFISKEKIKEVKPVVENQTIAITEPIKATPANLQNQKTATLQNETAQSINKTENNIENNKAQTASYISDASADNQDYVFYDVSADEFRKSKVGGFLKKVKRIVERTNPIARIFTGDEEQIAAK